MKQIIRITKKSYIEVMASALLVCATTSLFVHMLLIVILVNYNNTLVVSLSFVMLGGLSFHVMFFLFYSFPVKLDELIKYCIRALIILIPCLYFYLPGDDVFLIVFGGTASAIYQCKFYSHLKKYFSI